MNVCGLHCQIWNHFSNEGVSICFGVPWAYVECRGPRNDVKEAACSTRPLLHSCFFWVFFVKRAFIWSIILTCFHTSLAWDCSLAFPLLMLWIISFLTMNFPFAFLSFPHAPPPLTRFQTPRVHFGDDRFLFDACRFLFSSRNETACLTALPQMTNSVFILSFPPFVLFAYRVVSRLF